jgi:hypothetical protein
MTQVTIARLEAGLAVLARITALDGSIYAPLVDKQEKELEMLRRQEDSVTRAKRLSETTTFKTTNFGMKNV